MQANPKPVVCPRGASAYIWRDGDTLENIALASGVTMQAVELANPGTDFSALPAGSTVCIPPQQLSCLSGQMYRVRPGDTFQQIADDFDITVLELQERNPGVDPQNLRLGQMLCVPRTADEEPEPERPVPPPQRPSAPTVSPCPAGYVAKAVQYGQTYADLLVENNVSYRAMRLSNPQLIPGYLIAGAKYCAPPAGTRQLCGGGESRYTIQPGETLATLAQRFRVSPGRLLQMNPTLLPTDFSSGTVICVP